MFQLTEEEAESLRSHFATLKSGRGRHRKYLPYAFTEQGVAMLSSVLNSDRAIEVNVQIMRAFVKLREMLSTHKDLARKLADMEKKYDAQFKVVFDAIRQLMKPDEPKKRKIGFHRKEGKGNINVRMKNREELIECHFR
jgi:phage regulator Rha-like protein